VSPGVGVGFVAIRIPFGWLVERVRKALSIQGGRRIEETFANSLEFASEIDSQGIRESK